MTPASQPPSDRLTEAEVLTYLSAHRYALSVRQIAEGLRLSHTGRRDLKKILEHLEHTGAIEECGPNQYRIARRAPEAGAAKREPPRPATQPPVSASSRKEKLAPLATRAHAPANSVWKDRKSVV